jgi:phosphate-selective porin OprO and OprP
MKKIFIIVIAASSLLFAQQARYADASEMTLLVDKLVEKGILTQYEAQILTSQAKEEAAKKELSDNLVKTTWKNRLEFSTPDGNFKGRIGGRLHSDMVYIKGQSSLAERTGTNFGREDRAFFRRARLYFQGTAYEDFFYKFQWDFAGGTNGFRDAYVGMQNIPYIGKFMVGQFKEPFSLEELTSSNNITFIERSLPVMFAPGRSWGAAIKNNWLDQRLTFGLGAFRNSNEGANMVTGNEWNLTTRVTALPWYEAADKLAHLGVSYSLRVPDSNSRSFSQRPELRTTTRFVDTGTFMENLDNRLGIEGAVVYGPLSIQGEFIQAWAEPKAPGTSKTSYFHGAYGYVSYFLTGENRKYSKSSGAFSGVSPKKNFSLKDGTWGAWEIAARYSYLDLDQKNQNITGGILNDITLGINWYLSPNLRAMLNYVHTHRVGVGHADGIQARVQVTF